MSTAAPDSPFGVGGPYISLVEPVIFDRLHAELCAAHPVEPVHAVLHVPDMSAPISPDNPGVLFWSPATVPADTVAKVLAEHDPSGNPIGDQTSTIGDPRFHGIVERMRELDQNGGALTVQELSDTVKLLFDTVFPRPQGR